jgi:hypothetical protein
MKKIVVHKSNLMGVDCISLIFKMIATMQTHILDCFVVFTAHQHSLAYVTIFKATQRVRTTPPAGP